MATASIDVVPSERAPAQSYRYAHWYFLAALFATIAGFWPSFFSRVSETDGWHSLHGITATLWVVALATQSWLMSRGLVRWHRRVAVAALLLLPIIVVSALYMVRLVLTNTRTPFPPAMLAFIDLPSVAFLVALVALALVNRRTPAAHKRFMSATVLLGLPPALTRLYARVLFPGIGPANAFQASLLSVELILLALIAFDWRAGERRLAYPLSLAFFLAVHLLIQPVSSSDTWRSAMDWYVALPIFR
jgi:uncharacterized membrane protein YozB (DUF420 family)